MNKIALKGTVRNIQPSHKINDIEYDKADIVIKRRDGKEDVLNLRFKKFSNPYVNDQEVRIVGNVRSYSKQVAENKNKVDIYVFTYFDEPELNDNDQEVTNEFNIDGRICKIDQIRTTANGKQNIHFILANNLIIEESNQKLNSYLPCIAWGTIARKLSQCSVNDQIEIKGELHSRTYTKPISDTDVEIRVAHELVVTSVDILSHTQKEGA